MTSAKWRLVVICALSPVCPLVAATRVTQCSAKCPGGTSLDHRHQRAMDELLKCPVCLETFNTKTRLPKALPCQHTVCLACARVLVRRSPDVDFTCPVCREDVDVPDGLAEKLRDCLRTKQMLDVLAATKSRKSTRDKEDSPAAAPAPATGDENGTPCELCIAKFDGALTMHMAEAHPGCGQRQGGASCGYDSEGNYSCGYAGQCGLSGNDQWYIMCPNCRDKYLQQRRHEAGATQGTSKRHEKIKCELCRRTFDHPVTLHMRKDHPGCGECADGWGYTDGGEYCLGFEGNCGDGGTAELPVYTMCQICSFNYKVNESRDSESESDSASDNTSTSSVEDEADDYMNAHMVRRAENRRQQAQDSEDSDYATYITLPSLTTPPGTGTSEDNNEPSINAQALEVPGTTHVVATSGDEDDYEELYFLPPRADANSAQQPTEHSTGNGSAPQPTTEDSEDGAGYITAAAFLAERSRPVVENAQITAQVSPVNDELQRVLNVSRRQVDLETLEATQRRSDGALSQVTQTEVQAELAAKLAARQQKMKEQGDAGQIQPSRGQSVQPALASAGGEELPTGASAFQAALRPLGVAAAREKTREEPSDDLTRLLAEKFKARQRKAGEREIPESCLAGTLGQDQQPQAQVGGLVDRSAGDRGRFNLRPVQSAARKNTEPQSEFPGQHQALREGLRHPRVTAQRQNKTDQRGDTKQGSLRNEIGSAGPQGKQQGQVAAELPSALADSTNRRPANAIPQTAQGKSEPASGHEPQTELQRLLAGKFHARYGNMNSDSAN